jgi:hypothetical protein
MQRYLLPEETWLTIEPHSPPLSRMAPPFRPLWGSTMERRCSLAAALAISVVLLTQAYSAEEQKPRVPGIYSDLAFNNDAGDLLGTEMFIIPIGHSEYVAFFQCWGGESTQPVTVPVKVNGDAISFTVRSPSCGVGAYKGRISKNAFDGTVTRRLTDGSSKTEPVHLKRKQSYWQ